VPDGPGADGWELHAIATFAGHCSAESTLTYIHLSRRDLADKLNRSMGHIHGWRVEMLAGLGEQAVGIGRA
jgi:integrase/recombinase XerD